MQYLIKKGGGGRVHFWTGLDTVCHMASTGGLNVRRYAVSTTMISRGRICEMCQVNRAKLMPEDLADLEAAEAQATKVLPILNRYRQQSRRARKAHRRTK